jgi:branched-chain amino acid transport system substrate-binding protein
VITNAMQAHFRYVNEELGGVEMADGQTRTVDLVVYDDGYTPARAVENTRRLVDEDQVFGVVGMIGTPSNTAIVDYLNQQEVPHVFAASGASHWGAKPEEQPWTIGWQPAYPTETAIYAQFLTENNPGAKVAIMFQNDDFGRDNLNGFKAAIEGTDIEIVAEQSYEVTDPTVSSQVTNLSRVGADVFLNLSTPKFAAQAIQARAQIGWEPLHILSSVSNTIATVLEPAGPQNSVGVISSTYIKDPTDPGWDDDEGMRLYKEKAQQYGEVNVRDPFGAFGWALADSFVKGVLARMEAPTRQAMMDAVRSLDGVEIGVLLPGITLNTSGTEDGFPIESMQLQRFDGTTWELQGGLIDYEGRTPIPD